MEVSVVKTDNIDPVISSRVKRRVLQRHTTLASLKEAIDDTITHGGPFSKWCRNHKLVVNKDTTALPRLVNCFEQSHTLIL